METSMLYGTLYVLETLLRQALRLVQRTFAHAQKQAKDETKKGIRDQEADLKKFREFAFNTGHEILFPDMNQPQIGGLYLLKDDELFEALVSASELNREALTLLYLRCDYLYLREVYGSTYQEAKERCDAIQSYIYEVAQTRYLSHRDNTALYNFRGPYGATYSMAHPYPEVQYFSVLFLT